ncbi:MAG TPA: aldehyde dehydrogenase family protein [Burkholderiaceae bacterium]|nr:aldehyde dehydrogenase family protein [Burkholderiaceae bacterium]
MSGTLLKEVLRDAGLPPCVINHVTGLGGKAGAALAAHPDVAGITVTGSYEVGMSLVRAFARRDWPRPCLAEMGGKIAAIVSRHADLERAALGIMRSTFGPQGQKCSACSRAYVERPVADMLRQRLTALTRAIRATTGTWPGYQPFGGWKASGSTGKSIGSSRYLPQYLREQSQTVVA